MSKLRWPDSGCSENSSSYEEREFDRYISRLSIPDNICRWPNLLALPYSMERASDTNSKFYIRFITEIIGKESIILEQPLERISDLNNYQGLILLWTFFNYKLSHTDIRELLNKNLVT